MGLGHDGLKKLLLKHTKNGGAELDVTTLAVGDLVMCLNTFGDKLKIIGHQGLVIGYLKLPNKQRIMREALQYIPNTFGSAGFNYDKACKISLQDRMGHTKPSGPHESVNEYAKARARRGV